MVKTVFVLILVLFLSPQIYSECLPKEESYKKYVERTSLAQSINENETSIELLRKHLECHPDKEVYYKLAVIYEYIGKHYLAGIAYKNAGRDDEYKRMETIRLQIIASKKMQFQTFADLRAEKYLKRYKRRKGVDTALFIGGAVSVSTGLALFIHDKSGGENPPGAQYGLMFGGISLMGLGLLMYPWTEKTLEVSKWYENSSERINIKEDTQLYERLIHIEADNTAKKYSSKKFRNAGIGLLMMSIPLTALAVYGFYDSYNIYLTKEKSKQPEEQSTSGVPFENIGLVLTHFLQLSSFTPAILSITGGSILLYKSLKYKQLNTEPSILTLSNIAPIIDPVSKTYGIALGFSF